MQYCTIKSRQIFVRYCSRARNPSIYGMECNPAEYRYEYKRITMQKLGCSRKQSFRLQIWHNNIFNTPNLLIDKILTQPAWLMVSTTEYRQICLYPWARRVLSGEQQRVAFLHGTLKHTYYNVVVCVCVFVWCWFAMLRFCELRCVLMCVVLRYIVLGDRLAGWLASRSVHGATVDGVWKWQLIR